MLSVVAGLTGYNLVEIYREIEWERDEEIYYYFFRKIIVIIK